MNDVLEQVERFDHVVWQYEEASGKEVCDDVKIAVITSGFAPSRDSRHQGLAEHIALNAERVNSYGELRWELHEFVRTRRFMADGAGVSAASGPREGAFDALR